ncbi:hypothetical protein DY000_02018821 [Brassica cretica]|uniref:Uncharacterized protein n=1 Tax=Brassica cretica TaxID=69181 RepID=A0ABQ7D6V5_BRACR|nr:hypothetical protein DY000_02018821 [Brassica cretica]
MDINDPLFSLVPYNLMGIDNLSGKPKIAEEVLDNMRIYIKSADGPEKMAREERVKKSLKELEDDSLGQKTFLRLEAPPIVSNFLDKGKGVVFDFNAKDDRIQPSEKLMASAFKAGTRVLNSGKVLSQMESKEVTAESVQSVFIQEGSTGIALVSMKLVLPRPP